MPKSIKVKKAAKKRPYKKKTFTTKELFQELVKPEPPPPKQDNELKELISIISIFDNWNPEQRSRNLKYLASRYYDFL